MTTPIMPGSRIDTKPLMTCSRCERPSHQAGGVFIGSTFRCAGCYRGQLFARRYKGVLNENRSNLP